MKKLLILLLSVFLTACSTAGGDGVAITDATSMKTGTEREEKQNTEQNTTQKAGDFEPAAEVRLINPDGNTVQERIAVPDGYERIKAGAGSFGEYLRNLPLKPDGSAVRHYNGNIKPADVHVAVIDMDIGNRDLQQCADAVIRLRAEYLFGKGFYDRIHFNFTNGFRADYSTWRQGSRIRIDGNKAYWVKQAESSTGYDSFRKYLDMVFSYAGTLSLSQELEKVPPEDIRIGDVFIKGATPGHCVIVLDMAENRDSGEKCFLLAQSYMPAQDIHILKNPANNDQNPWYQADFGDTLVTPEWTFTADQLARFGDEPASE